MFSNKIVRWAAALGLALGLLLSPASAQVSQTGGGLGTPVVCVPSTAVSLTFTGGTISGVPTTTFTRASANGTYINSGGTLTTATTDAARFNYDANYPRGNAAPSLTGPFLLYEPAATNLAFQSNAFNTAPWFKTASAVAASGIFTSPDGTLDGWSLTSGTGFGGNFQPLTVSNISYVLSSWVNRQLSTPVLNFLLNAANSGNITTSATTIRYAAALTPAAGSSTNDGLFPNAASGNTLGIFGFQTETGTVATSYIATTTTAQTRATDALAFTVPSCVGHLTVTFDDNSTQSVAVSPGAYTLTTTLNRPNIKTIVGAA